MLLTHPFSLSQATFASKIEKDNGNLRVTREIDGGLETIKVKLPCIVSADLRYGFCVQPLKHPSKTTLSLLGKDDMAFFGIICF